MRAIMVMYDSLRLDMLPSYGGKEVELPNFKRLEQHTAAFNNSYVCSLPCMPARRELHTGRPNFLHRSWGPLEPFDDSMPEILKTNGIFSAIMTDHNHYVEDGGGTYLPRYSVWECNRGQEGDPWKGLVKRDSDELPHTIPFKEDTPKFLRDIMGRLYTQDVVNRKWMVDEEDYPQAKTFSQGVEFIDNNHTFDNWFLQIETFDPHEPFTSPDKYIAKLFDPDSVSELDWPPYAEVNESSEVVADIRKKYLALLIFCDENLGKVLDKFDEYDLWKDTMLIVNTDHGFLLGEHSWWAKSMMPEYQEIAHTPLFIWDPRFKAAGEKRNSLVQTIDLAPTILEYFGLKIPKDMIGKPLSGAIQRDEPVREYGIFGSHSGILNITDGVHVLMLAPKENAPALYNYTLMPTHMRSRMSVQELQAMELAEPFSFTKGLKVLKIPAASKQLSKDLGAGDTLLFNVLTDPCQNAPITNQAVVDRMKKAALEILKENDAPSEIYERYGF